MARGHDLDPDLDFGSHIHIQTTGNGETQAVPTGLRRGQVVFPLIRFIFVIVLPRKMRVERQLNCLPGQTAIKNGNRKKIENLMFVCVSIQCLFVCRKAVVVWLCLSHVLLVIDLSDYFI